MPFDKSKYPPYWDQFSEYIRFERAGGLCEACGVINGFIKYTTGSETVIADPNDVEKIFEIEEWFGGSEFRRTKIVLTVAHLDNEGGICTCKEIYGFKCARPDHVLALCQKCHLSLDRPARQKARSQRKDAARELLNARSATA